MNSERRSHGYRFKIRLRLDGGTRNLKPGFAFPQVNVANLAKDNGR